MKFFKARTGCKIHYTPFHFIFACELVRARFPLAETKKEAAALAEELAELLENASIAQVLGHTALFYRPSRERLISLDPPI